MTDLREHLFAQIDRERTAQDQQWGGIEHDRTHCPLDWARIICRLVINAAEEDQSADWADSLAQQEIIKVATTAIAWIEARSVPQ